MVRAIEKGNCGPHSKGLCADDRLPVRNSETSTFTKTLFDRIKWMLGGIVTGDQKGMVQDQLLIFGLTNSVVRRGSSDFIHPK